MTLVKFNPRLADKRFNNLFEDFFNQFPNRFFHEDNVNSVYVPVNIRETDKTYVLEVIAPGLEKNDFKINIDQNLLTIAAEKKAEQKSETERLVRKEYTVKSFARTFTLDESIQPDGITAKYENGVLWVELPKKVEAKVQPKEINIQ